MDQVIYWYTDCDSSFPKLTSNFEEAAKEYLKFNPYNLFVYVPVEFELENSDTLRYFDNHRHLEDKIAARLYKENKTEGKIAKHFITVSGSVEKRVEIVMNYLETIL